MKASRPAAPCRALRLTSAPSRPRVRATGAKSLMRDRPPVRVWFFVALGLSGATHAGDPGTATEGLAWLKKMASASRQLNYSGTIVYQQRNHVETSRVVHFVNSAGGEFEKLETLDGPPREVVRSNEQVICYLPSVKTVLIEERNRSTRNFPALVPEQLGNI